VITARTDGPMPENLAVIIALPWEVTPVLAVDGTSFALGAGRRAWSGAYPDPPTALRALAARSGARPETVAVDLHPAAARTVSGTGLPVRAVARHHALVAAVLAAHGLGPDEQAIGFAFDGGGSGADGATWGGEVLIAGYKGFRRVAHLGYVRCAGTGAGRPHRAALAHLRHAGVPWELDLAPVRACPTRERRVLARQLETGYGCEVTSSLGLLLDAVWALVGTAGPPAAAPGGDPYPMVGLEPGGLVRAVVADVRRGVPAEVVASRVNATVAAAVAVQARRCAEETGLDVVVLAGDAFDDPALAGAARAALRGFTVLAGRPPLVWGRLLCAAAG
jgi:hydrogenase maturation protein HypF